MAQMGGNSNRGNARIRVRGSKFKNTSGMNRKEKHEFDQNKEIISIKKQLREVKGAVELKYLDTYINDPEIDTTGSLFLLNGIAVGDTQITRTGGQIKLTSLQFRLSFIMPNDLISYAGVRVIVFWDRQANGLAPLVADNPLAGIPALLNNAVILSLLEAPYQYENIDRFHVLYDKRMAMNPQVVLNTTAGLTDQLVPSEFFINKYIKLNRTTKYDSTGNVIDDINTNSLYMLVLTDVAANQPGVIGGTRIYFRDA